MRVFACALLVIATAHAGLVCEPGDSNDNGETACFCIGDGLGWICAPSDHNVPALANHKISPVEERCKPGKFFKQYCNECHCGSDGRVASAVCTMMACDENLWNRDGSRKNPEDIPMEYRPSVYPKVHQIQDTCEPGKEFNYYCNTCYCGFDGLVAHSVCTKMYCDERYWNKNGTRKEPKLEVVENPLEDEIFDLPKNCKPGKSFKHYCNSCICGKNGEAACTDMFCDPDVWNKDGTLKDSVEVVENADGDDVNSCEPGKKFKNYCNDCICGKNGQAACTKMYCDPKVWNKDGSLKINNVEENQDTCEPGKKFNYYCNTCFCGPDGKVAHSACTRMACDGGFWNKDGSMKLPNEIAHNPLLRQLQPVQENQDTCEPGKKFNYYCNTCFCGPDGIVAHSACTRMGCDGGFWNKDGSMKLPHEIDNNPLLRQTREAEEVTCEPGKKFKNYCNDCSCGENGKAACTKMYCDPKVWNKDGSLKINVEENQDTCEPGKKFKYYCNTCFCGPDGKVAHAACTRMACNGGFWNKDGSIKLPNEIAQNPLLRQIREAEEATCEPGKKFKHYCNDCACGENGKAACTKMYCDPKVWNKDGSLKINVEENQDTCEPGKKFNYYCNTCFCGPDGKVAHAACTRMACNGGFWNKDGSIKLPNEIANNPLLRQIREVEEATCEPGKKFKNYCNDCACGKNGKAACTKMYCDPKVWNKDGSLKINVEENQDTCEPGKKFNYYCNTCFCGPDGKVAHAACTRMACNGGFWNKDGSIKLPNEIANNPLLRQIPEAEEITCEPGKRFKNYCNDCACGKNGKAACTKMYCDPKVWNKDGSLKINVEENQDTCEPGKKFKYYCNTCFCGPDGKVAHAACTRMACNGGFWNKDGSIKLPNEIANNPLLRQIREAEEDTCEPGKRFKNYCNDCFCGPEGLVRKSACTRMECNHDIWNKDGTLKIDVASNPLLRKEPSTNFLCQPGKLFKDECNDCTCGKDGKSKACTMMLCPPRDDGRVIAPQVCEPRKNFKIECNDCTCSDDGTKIACTKMACHSVAKRSAKQVCKPKSTFKKDCNTCVCNDDGTGAACTLKGCIAPMKEKVCEPSSTFKKDCNICTCNSDGTGAACTLVGCIDPPAKKVCEPNSTFKKDCNTCTCNNDGTGAACTLIGCMEVPPKKKVCEPFSTFKKDCNTCTCNSDGTSAACTLMGCMEVPIKKRVCEPNSTFKQDCNTCTCNKDGTSAACTLVACMEPKKKVCEPFSTFKKDCNTCTCNSDGTSAACTLMGCMEVPIKKRVCEPNSTFKQDCNTCTCNKDGTSAACTLIGCLEPPAKKVCQPNSTFKQDCNTCVCNKDGTSAACTLIGCMN